VYLSTRLAFLALTVPALCGAEPPGYKARFYGWHPQSLDFAYAIEEHRAQKAPRARYYMKQTRDAKQVMTGKTFGGSVPRRARQNGYRTTEIEGQRLSPFVQAFIVAPGRTLRIVLELRGDRLGYSALLDDVTKPGEPTRLIGGHFKEVWTDFDARVFRSPDGNWVAVVLNMATPYKQQAWVEGLRVGGR